MCAAPVNSDFTYYTATPLTNTDWANNFHQVVTYLTGTADVTFDTITCGAITATGAVGITGNTTITGDLTVTGALSMPIFIDRGDPDTADKTEATMTQDGNWYDWDISGIVTTGAKAVLVRVQVRYAPGTGLVLGLKNKDNAHTLNASYVVTQVAGINTYMDVVVSLPALNTRIIQYYVATSGAEIGLVVKGWWF
jgi:hypothetical protein